VGLEVVREVALVGVREVSLEGGWAKGVREGVRDACLVVKEGAMDSCLEAGGGRRRWWRGRWG